MILERNCEAVLDLNNKLKELDNTSIEYKEIENKIAYLKKEYYDNLTAWDHVLIARNEKRLKAQALIDALITNFFELHGDQYYGDDNAIIGGIGYLGDMPVTVIAEAKGRNTEENITRNFGMPSPEGYRKALRLAHEAEKFHRPIITIVDTPGAYPGRGAEERGQARAIANCISEFSSIKTPVICLILSEGGSGGALALTIGDYIMMFENAIYSVLSPEGFTSILFKNKVSVEDVSEMMKMTSKDLSDYSIVDEIIPEVMGGIKSLNEDIINKLKNSLINKFKELLESDTELLLSNRYDKYRNIGRC